MITKHQKQSSCACKVEGVNNSLLFETLVFNIFYFGPFVFIFLGIFPYKLLLLDYLIQVLFDLDVVDNALFILVFYEIFYLDGFG